MVAYYRVSTDQQHLSFGAQRRAVLDYMKPTDELAGEFVEVESGKVSHRPQLAAAIALAQELGGLLVIAKLDRLSRSVSFVASLMDAGVQFVACDLPDASAFTVHIMAAVAQQEREAISARTRAALAELKAQGKRLGSPANLTPAARKKGAAAVRAKAQSDPRNKAAAAMIAVLMEDGKTLVEIAAALNAAGYARPKGGRWVASTVSRIRTLFELRLPLSGGRVEYERTPQTSS